MAFMSSRVQKCLLHIDKPGSANSYLFCSCGMRWYLTSADNVLGSARHGMFSVYSKTDSYSYSYILDIRCDCGGVGSMQVSNEELKGYSASSSYSLPSDYAPIGTAITTSTTGYMTVDARTFDNMTLSNGSTTASWSSVQGQTAPPKNEKKERGEKALQHYINKARLKATI